MLQGKGSLLELREYIIVRSVADYAYLRLVSLVITGNKEIKILCAITIFVSWLANQVGSPFQ